VIRLCIGQLVPLIKDSHNLYLISTYILSKLVCARTRLCRLFVRFAEDD